jgi:hypothetical protein
LYLQQRRIQYLRVKMKIPHNLNTFYLVIWRLVEAFQHYKFRIKLAYSIRFFSLQELLALIYKVQFVNVRSFYAIVCYRASFNR